MAPLRFRCWDPTVKQMAVDITLEFLAQQNKLAVPHLNVALKHATRSGLVIMPSTGLFDKNRKEIFEGDILAEREGDDSLLETRGAVAFAEGCFRIQLRISACRHEKDIGHNMGVYTLYKRLAYEPEVIGNIYEHPDLLPKAA